MTPDELRKMIAYLKDQVQLRDPAERTVLFAAPAEGAMLAAALHPEGVRQLLSAPWLPEMIVDVLETPEFCDPGDPPERCLQFARDVVAEYINKRFQL